MVSITDDVEELARFETIVRVLVKHEVGYLLKEKKDHHQKKLFTPNVLVDVLQDLGGTYVKLGQFLSLRPDLIPHEYSEALAALQDHVTPFPTPVAKQIITRELGVPCDELFTDFPQKPVAAASIGQVYKAHLQSGESVAIKVMRPGLAELLESDLLLLFHFAHYIKKHFHQSIINPLTIVEEFKMYSQQELNYLGEVQALVQTAKNFKHIRRVAIPKPYKELCTEHVLTMSFIEGTPLRQALLAMSKTKKRNLAEELTHITFKQLFIDGFFHADLHPGNILVTKQGVGLLDFGITSAIDDETKQSLAILFISLLTKNLDGVIKSMGDLHLYAKTGDRQMLKRELALTLGPLYGVSMNKFDIAEVFIHCIRIAQENNVSVPRELLLIGKTVITLQGVLEEVDPSFNPVEVAKPFISEIMAQQSTFDGLFVKAGDQAIKLASFITTLPEMTREYFNATERVEHDLRDMSREVRSLGMTLTFINRQALIVLLIILLSVVSFLSWNSDGGLHLLAVIAAAIAGFLILVLAWQTHQLTLTQREEATL